MLFLITLSLSSAHITVIFMLDIRFSESARMAPKTVGGSRHFGVQASFTLLALTSISPCINSMPPGSLPYLSRSTPCTLTQRHFWYPVESMTLGSTLLAAYIITSRSIGSNILLVAVALSRPLRLPFSLYASGWKCTCKENFLVLKAVLIVS